jgi:hypothetical protein
MRKVRLDMDALKVESFATAERGADKRGTVRGHSSPDFTCWQTCDRICPSISGPAPCDCAPESADGASCG